MVLLLKTHTMTKISALQRISQRQRVFFTYVGKLFTYGDGIFCSVGKYFTYGDRNLTSRGKLFQCFPSKCGQNNDFWTGNTVFNSKFSRLRCHSDQTASKSTVQRVKRKFLPTENHKKNTLPEIHLLQSVLAARSQ